MTDTMAATRSKLGLILWLCAIGVFVLSVVVGVVVAAVGISEDGLAALAVLFVPLVASAVYAPLTVAAFITSIVGIRKPGVRLTREWVAVIGSGISTPVSVGAGLLALAAYGIGF